MRGRVLVGAIVLGAMAVGPVGVSQGAVAPEHGYVTDTMKLPTTNNQAASLGRDVDGNGTRDNRLGLFYATLAANGFDLLTNAPGEATAAGEVVMLHSLRASTLSATKNATWQVWYGAPTTNPDLTGTGTFALRRAQPHSSLLAATIRNHHVQTAAGNIPVRLDLGPADPVLLTMKKATVTATCLASGCSGGKLNGAVTAQQINDTLIPRMVAMFNPLIKRDCVGTDRNSCLADSTGKTIVDLFDTNGDLVITDNEVRTAPLTRPFLRPDLDLVKANGAPGRDGVTDAVSFGFGFTTVHASLTRP
jgi:hypothetical protein